MKQLICTGDSLAALWPIVAEELIEHDDFFSYEFGGAGLELQTKMLLNHYISYSDVSNMIVLSQFTGMGRLSSFLPYLASPEDTYCFTNSLTGQQEYIVNNSKRHEFTKLSDEDCWNAGPTRVRDLVAIHCMLADLGADVRVFRGWLGVMPQELWKKCCSEYDKHGVIYTNETYVETALSIDANPEAWLDEFHPDIDLVAKAFKIILEDLQ